MDHSGKPGGQKPQPHVHRKALMVQVSLTHGARVIGE